MAYIQTAYGERSAAGTTMNITLGASPTNGNCLILCIAVNGGVGITGGVGTAHVTGISQTGATWTKQIAHNDLTNGNGFVDVEIWAAFNVSGAGTGITVTINTTNIAAVARVSEFSTVLTSSALDKTASDDDGTSATNLDTGGSGVTTTQANELWVVAYAFTQSGGLSGTGTFTDDGTWTNLLGSGTVGGTTWDVILVGYNPALYCAVKTVASTGHPTDDATVNTTLTGWSGAVATFKLVTSASTNYSLFYAGD